MKKIGLLITLTLICYEGISQTLPKGGILKYTQTIQYEGNAPSNFLFALCFTNTEGILKPLENKTLATKDEIIIPIGKGDKELSTYINLSKKIIISRSNAFTEKVIVNDELVPIKWRISKENKKFGRFLCQKAEADVRGRHYFVWFTPEIPVGFGPWKLYGLPGLILEAEDSTGEVKFIFESVELNSILPCLVNPPKSNGKQKELSQNDYVKLINKNSDNAEKMMSSTDSKSEIRGKISRKSIEIY